jgi:hypothetical protein
MADEIVTDAIARIIAHAMARDQTPDLTSIRWKVREKVRTAVVRLNEAAAGLGVEPDYRARSHHVVRIADLAPASTASAPSTATLLRAIDSTR